jgi:hypothetical protein
LMLIVYFDVLPHCASLRPTGRTDWRRIHAQIWFIRGNPVPGVPPGPERQFGALRDHVPRWRRCQAVFSFFRHFS